MMGKPTLALLALLSSTIILGAVLTIPSVTTGNLGCAILRSLGVSESDEHNERDDDGGGLDNLNDDDVKDDNVEENDNDDRIDEDRGDDVAENDDDIEDNCDDYENDEEAAKKDDEELENDSLEFGDIDLTIKIEPLQRIMSRNATEHYEITISSFGIYENTSLTLEAILPEGTTSSFALEHGFPNFTSTLEIATSKSTPEGNYSLTVIASNGIITRSKDVTLIIQDFFDFEVNVTPLTSTTMTPDQDAVFLVEVETLSGAPSLVTLEKGCRNAVINLDLPCEYDRNFVHSNHEDLSYSLSPTSGIPPFEAILTVMYEGDEPVGKLGLTFWLKSEVTEDLLRCCKSASVEVLVFDLGISVLPDVLQVARGEEGQFVVNINGFEFDSSVSLEVTGLPLGATSLFSPEFGVGTFVSTLTIPADDTTSVGAYNLAIVAKGDLLDGSVIRSADVMLVVGPDSRAQVNSNATYNYAIYVTPEYRRINQGESTYYNVTVDLMGNRNLEIRLSTSCCAFIDAKVQAELDPLTPFGGECGCEMLRTVLHISTNESTTVRHTIVTAISGHAYIVDPPIYRDGRFILEISPPQLERAEVRSEIFAPPRFYSPDPIIMGLANIPSSLLQESEFKSNQYASLR